MASPVGTEDVAMPTAGGQRAEEGLHGGAARVSAAAAAGGQADGVEAAPREAPIASSAGDQGGAAAGPASSSAEEGSSASSESEEESSYEDLESSEEEGPDEDDESDSDSSSDEDDYDGSEFEYVEDGFDDDDEEEEDDDEHTSECEDSQKGAEAAPAPAPSCCICMERCASGGAHRVCCIPCGHVYGRSCLDKWLRHSLITGAGAKCPQCGQVYRDKQIINLFITEQFWDGDNCCTISRETSEVVDLDWENLGFGLVQTDFMYVAKCGPDGNFPKGEVIPFGPIALSPFAGVLNYGQGLFEGLKAYRKTDGSILLFRPEENAIRMRTGADRMCMPAPTVEQFMEAVKHTVLANEIWVPPTGKGSLYIRPLLIGSGAVLGLAPAPEYTFITFVSPVGNYFKEGLSPINLIVEENFHRASPGGTGGVKTRKTIGNYASVLLAHKIAKEKGYLYLDAVHNKYLEEVSSCNIFVVKGNVISTPAIKGTILPGITRKSIIEVAQSKGFKVEERLVSVDDLLDADEVFRTGTAVVVSPVGSITYMGKRVKYGNQGVGVVSQQLYESLTSLQMGNVEDWMGWTVRVTDKSDMDEDFESDPYGLTDDDDGASGGEEGGEDNVPPIVDEFDDGY